MEIVITGIGSLPLRNVDEAIDLIFCTCPEIPFWPQLPKRSKKENMYSPFIEGVPFFVTTEDGAVYVDEERETDLDDYLALIEDEKVDAFSINEDLIPGFYRLLERFKEVDATSKAVKTQITGPISMAMGIKDKKGVPVIYNDFLFDIVKRTLNMRAKWMIRELKKCAPQKEVVIFFDEPYLVAYGSIYFSFSKERIMEALEEVGRGLQAKKGVHCCGNTDWSLVLKTSLDIVNYDAYSFLESMFLHIKELENFLDRGGMISPGVIPSTEDIRKTEMDNVKKILSTFFKELILLGRERSRDRIIVTPSCGLGGLQVDEAKKAMKMLKQVPSLVSEIFDKECPS
ncbi:MAG: hypothetical protein N2513_08830 [Deltaproteobacteria bacterium]|nr:hypothetical protein [Deltaproteobacteria bacterium]